MQKLLLSSLCSVCGTCMQLPAQVHWCASKYRWYISAWLKLPPGCEISALFTSAAAFSGSDKRMCSTGPLAVLRFIGPLRDAHVQAGLQILPSGRSIKEVLPQLDMDEEQLPQLDMEEEQAGHRNLEKSPPSGHYPQHPNGVEKKPPSTHLSPPLVADKSPPLRNHPAPLLTDKGLPSWHHPAPLLADRGPPLQHHVPTVVADRDTRWAKQCGLCDML